MDHHCPWLATCVGLHNYKAFLLFLIYTTLFCFMCFGVSACWVYREILNEGEYTESLMPVNYVMLAVISGIIGLVLAGFTGWHILLASRGQTTIECLEKTRYLSPLRKSMQHQQAAQHREYITPDYGRENESARSDPGMAVRQEGQEMVHGEQRFANYDAMERVKARQRYEEYLDEQDSEKLPSAFDLGWKKNLLHLFGPRKMLWMVPICNTTGDGWSWEPSPKWLNARDKIAREREEQRLRETNAGWGDDVQPRAPVPNLDGAGRHYAAYPSRSTSKADRILGRSPGSYMDEEAGLSMHTLRSHNADDYESSSDEDVAAQRVLDRKADRSPAGGWPHKVGIVTNTLLGNTLARQKDDVRGWDGQDEGVD
jgi:hypothetical protein